MKLRRLFALLFALALSASLTFAQTTSSSDQSSGSDQSTTTTKKARKSKSKSGAKTATTAAGDTAKDTASDTAAGSKTAAGKTKTAASSKVDINSATKEELDALPGIGEALSQKIIDNRPYRTKTDLLRKKVIPQSAYNPIKDQIIAHQASGTTAGKSTKSSKKQ